MAKVRQAVKCTGINRRSGTPCKRYAINGGKVCTAHGGALPPVRIAAERNLLEKKATKELRRLEAVLGPADPVDDPLTALARMAGEVMRWKELIAEQVSTLTSVGYEGMTGEQVNAAVQVFERALDRCVMVLATMAKLNIDERLAAVSEKQAAVVVDVLTAVLAEMGMNHEQQREARTRVAHKLRVVAS